MKHILLTLLLLSPLVYSESIYLVCEDNESRYVSHKNIRFIFIDTFNKTISSYEYIRNTGILSSIGPKIQYSERQHNLIEETEKMFTGKNGSGDDKIFIDRVTAVSTIWRSGSVENCQSISKNSFNKGLKKLKKRAEKDNPTIPKF